MFGTNTVVLGTNTVVFRNKHSHIWDKYSLIWVKYSCIWGKYCGQWSVVSRLLFFGEKSSKVWSVADYNAITCQEAISKTLAPLFVDSDFNRPGVAGAVPWC